MQVTHFNFSLPNSHIRKEFFEKAGKIHFNHIFSLSQYVPNSLISTCKTYWKLLMRYFAFFFPPRVLEIECVI